MEKVSYSSKHKFLVSLGVVIVILPFLLFYMYLNMLNDMVNYNGYSSFKEPEIVELLSFKQNILMFLKEQKIIFIFFSIILFLFGVCMISVGFKRWKEYDQEEFLKLKYDNENLKYDNEKKEKELRGAMTNLDTIALASTATPKEKQEKIELELAKSADSSNIQSFSVNKLMANERLLINKISESISQDFSVYQDFRLSNRIILDALAVSKSEKIKDRIYEFKFYKGDNVKLERIIQSLINYSKDYYETTQKECDLFLIIVTPSEQICKWESIIRSTELKEIVVELISEEELQET